MIVKVWEEVISFLKKFVSTPKVLEKIGRMPVTSDNVRIYTSYKNENKPRCKRV